MSSPATPPENDPAVGFVQPPVQPPPLEDCFYYHSVDLPQTGRVEAQWDLSQHLDRYWAGAEWDGRRVLEIGPASGFLTAALESRGASVTSLELASGSNWDVVRYRGWDPAEFVAARADLQARLLASYWRTHHELGLRARLWLGSVYDIPESLGEFDAATVSAVLLHLRDPLTALEQVAARVRDEIVVTEAIPGELLPAACLEALADANQSGSGAKLARLVDDLEAADLADPKVLYFRPDAEVEAPKETWWALTPRLVGGWLGVLGFETVSLRTLVLRHDSTHAFHKPPGHVDRVTFHPYFSILARRRVSTG